MILLYYYYDIPPEGALVEGMLLPRGLQLFRERLSEKVHVTIPKGIVGGFEFIWFQFTLYPMTVARSCSW